MATFLMARTTKVKLLSTGANPGLMLCKQVHYLPPSFIRVIHLFHKCCWNMEFVPEVTLHFKKDVTTSLISWYFNFQDKYFLEKTS
jgi:hypothetical protein